MHAGGGQKDADFLKKHYCMFSSQKGKLSDDMTTRLQKRILSLKKLSTLSASLGISWLRHSSVYQHFSGTEVYFIIPIDR